MSGRQVPFFLIGNRVEFLIKQNHFAEKKLMLCISLGRGQERCAIDHFKRESVRQYTFLLYKKHCVALKWESYVLYRAKKYLLTNNII